VREQIKLTKVKRPGGVFSFDMEALASDEHGEWLYAPAGSQWNAPHDAGALAFDVVVLLSADPVSVTWWQEDPGGRTLGVDVCLPPERSPDGWRFIDLELDPVRREDGAVDVEDEDEFRTACDQGWISPDEAAFALRMAGELASLLREWREPWGVEGWSRLASA
jgi:hypothetical protein